MSRIGYARVSSKNQNLARQLELLEGVSKVFSDKASGESIKREQLQAMLNYIREGDIVVVTELDRLGRNNKELTLVMNEIQQKSATLEVLNLPSMRNIEDENLRRLINNLIIELYKYQAEAERLKIKERQQQGIELAKQAGKYKGRKRKYSLNDERLLHAFELSEQGLSDAEVERKTGINRVTFKRYKKRKELENKSTTHHLSTLRSD